MFPPTDVGNPIVKQVKTVFCHPSDSCAWLGKPSNLEGLTLKGLKVKFLNPMQLWFSALRLSRVLFFFSE